MADLNRTLNLRSVLHHLDLSQANHKKIYTNGLVEFLKLNEGCRLYAYDDLPGRGGLSKRTVGIGFNLDRPSALQEWEQALGPEVPFEAVYKGNRPLTPEEVHRLFLCSIQQRIHELVTHHYTEGWETLKPNEQVAMIDAYYHGPGLVRRGTKFWEAIQDYVMTQRVQALKEAVSQIRDHSNPERLAPLSLPEAERLRFQVAEQKRRGAIQNRREVQAALLSSFECCFSSL